MTWLRRCTTIECTIFVPLWFFGTGGLWLCVPMAKKPKLWGVHVLHALYDTQKSLIRVNIVVVLIRR
ncbi:transmembrane protein, putative [Medicago truncatula]|uniref:Transmembrane protein, putative n=1 Tax=Medicago truncatula TaxID=3880 RepID=G7IJ57_MEDTR|nr:transmembrane protein, putative [Medicago truncatula]